MESVKIGRVTLWQADCLEAMRTMPDNAYSLAIVDPPYGIGESRKAAARSRAVNTVDPRTGKRNSITPANYKLKKWDSEPPTSDYFKELRRVSRNQIIWGGNYFLDHLPATSCVIVWDKVNGSSDFADCELAWTSFRTAARIFPYMWAGFLQGASITNGRVKQGDTRLCEKRIHPTQKPVNLYKWLLMNYAEKGATILDTHHGSGSLSVACNDMGFDLTAFEIDEEYFRDACERIEREQQQMKFEL